MGRQHTSVSCSSCVIPRYKLIHPALLVAIDNGGERAGQVGQRINSIELAGLCRPANYAERLF